MEGNEDGLIRHKNPDSHPVPGSKPADLNRVREGRTPAPPPSRTRPIGQRTPWQSAPDMNAMPYDSERVAPQEEYRHKPENKNYSLLGYAVFWLALTWGLIHFVGFAGHGSRVPAHLAGFGTGLAHGFLTVIAWVVSFFNQGVGVYESHNTGAGYNAGFILGLCSWLLSSKLYKRK